MKKRKLFLLIVAFIVLSVITVTIFINIAHSLKSNNYVGPDVISAAKTYANNYNLTKSSEQVTVHLDSILATTDEIYLWIWVEGVPDNDLNKYISDCTITDKESNVWKYSLHKNNILEHETYINGRPLINTEELQDNSVILSFTKGIQKDSYVSINFDFGDYGTVTFEEIYVKLAENFIYDISKDTFVEFDLPYAHCKILEVEYSLQGLFLNIQWELEEGFTESTKIDYPRYHTKFTFGDSNRFTFLLLPEQWSSSESVIISRYHLTEIVPVGKTIEIDMYLNDDDTFIRKLATISVE